MYAGRVTRTPHAASGFTILELLVVVSIIAVLLGILSTALIKVRTAAKSFQCKNKLKTVAFEFQLYPDEVAGANYDRDDSLRGFRNAAFGIEDFQERLYGLDEYWPEAHRNAPQAPIDPSKNALMCPAGPRTLTRYAGLPCSNYAVGPSENVSIGFNRRLLEASVQYHGRWVLVETRLHPRVLEHPYVPLAFDVDGAKASAARALPYYSAPAAGDPGQYARNRLWFPSLRHGGEMNVAFIGGHVESTTEPLTEPGWDWAYQPAVAWSM